MSILHFDKNKRMCLSLSVWLNEEDCWIFGRTLMGCSLGSWNCIGETIVGHSLLTRKERHLSSSNRRNWLLSQYADWLFLCRVEPLSRQCPNLRRSKSNQTVVGFAFPLCKVLHMPSQISWHIGINHNFDTSIYWHRHMLGQSLYQGAQSREQEPRSVACAIQDIW